jgi:hypothetical protein
MEAEWHMSNKKEQADQMIGLFSGTCFKPVHYTWSDDG